MGRDREGKRERRGRSESEESDEEEERRLRERKQDNGRGKRAKDDSDSDDASTESEDEGRGRRRRRSRDRNRDGGRRKKGKGDESSESDSEEEGDRRRKRRRSREGKKKSKRKGRGDSSEESESEEEKEDRRKKGSITRVSEEELREFLAKKAQKKALKLAKRLRQKSVSGYTNDSNPFGDTNLTETFVWRKKIEKDVLRGTLDPRNVTLKKEKERLESRMEEIEKVKKRREERLLEKAKHDEEMAMLARERARAEFQDWEKKEDEFHFQQSRVRSEIRLREGRAKPIDVLARNLNLSEDFDIEINEPYKIYKGLTVKEMEELKEDIKMHLDYDRNTPMHVQFWNAMMVVCNHEISEATRRDILDRARVRGEEPPPELLAEERGLHSAVNAEVEATLAAKSSEELGEMEERIQHQMESGGAKLVEYWESVLKKLKVYKAKARLREIHADLLRQHLEILQSAPAQQQQQQQQLEGDEGAEGDAAGRPAAANAGAAAAAAGSFSPELMTEEEAAAEGLILDEAEEGKEGGGGGGREVGGKAGGGSGSGGGGGGFSPELIHAYEGDNDDVVDPDADKAELEQKRLKAMELQQRRSVQRQGDGEAEAAGAGGGSSSHAMQAAAAAAASGSSEGKRGSGTDLTSSEKAAAMKMMGPADGDAILGAGSEVKLESQVYWWHDKFRPRKPKYFNRVHTGYEWNKYNQTHYDHDNPPPKIVQGYKFNIFYPDLIDRSKAPYYSVEKDGSNGETCLIRFHAGPPYEDIAFRIVNKEWEYSHKKGFKCTFDRGILHVYFNFKRYRYRR